MPRTRHVDLRRLAALGLLFLLPLFGSGCATTHQGSLELVMAGQYKVQDLSHPLKSGAVGIEGEAFESVSLKTIQRDQVNVSRLTLDDCAGTYLEAPARLLASTPSVDKLPMSQFFSNGVVIDVTQKVAEKSDYQLTKEDIDVWESENGPIPPDAIVLIRTDWSKRYGDPLKYQNADADGVPHYPGVSSQAAEFLTRERRVHALGIDTPSIYAGSGNAPGQRVFLMTGKYHLNNLTDLDRLPSSGSVILVLPLRIEGGGASPVRVVAIIPQEKTAVEPGKKKAEQDGTGMQGSPGMYGGY